MRHDPFTPPPVPHPAPSAPHSNVVPVSFTATPSWRTRMGRLAPPPATPPPTLVPTPTPPPKDPRMNATIENGQLIIRLPLQTPTPSASGKTLVVATSSGNKATECQVNGKPVIIGINAYIKP